MKISYDEIKNKIKERYMNGLYFVIEYVDEDKKKEIFSLVFGKKENNGEKINSLVEISNDKYAIYEYDSTDTLTNKTTKNLLVCEDSFPIFHIKHYNLKNNDVEYNEDTYIIYKNGSSRINSRICINTFRSEDFEKDDIRILDTDIYSKGYYQKDYQFIIKINEILSLKVDNNTYLIGEESFNSRCNNALKYINNVLGKITQKLEQATDDNIKIYCIKRHK